MLRNGINACLLSIAVVVLYLSVRGYLIPRAGNTYLDRLPDSLGDFDVVDPKKVYIRSIETNEHLNFAWRIYVPENVLIAHNLNYPGGSNSTKGQVFRLPLVSD